MRTRLTAAGAAIVAALAAAPANADEVGYPVATSCKILDVLTRSDADDLATLVGEFTGGWTPENRVGLVNEFTRLLETFDFGGGNVYRIRRFGDDIDEHLVTLHIRGGEVAGLTLRYEWAPDEMRLVAIAFERKYERFAAGVHVTDAEALECPTAAD